MVNQESKLTEIDISFPFVGGDKSKQGLREYISSPQFFKNSTLEISTTPMESNKIDMLGDSNNITSSDSE